MKTHNIDIDVLLRNVHTTASQLTQMSQELQLVVNEMRAQLPDEEDQESRKSHD